MSTACLEFYCHGHGHDMDMKWAWTWHGRTWHGVHDMTCMTWHDIACHNMTWHGHDMPSHDMTWTWHDMDMTWHGHDMHDMTWHRTPSTSPPRIFFPAWTPSSWRDPWHGIACRPLHPSRKSEFDFAPVWSDRCESQPRIFFPAWTPSSWRDPRRDQPELPHLGVIRGVIRAWSASDPKVIRCVFRWSGQMECANTWRKSVIQIGEPPPFIILKPFILLERDRAPGWRAPGHKD